MMILNHMCSTSMAESHKHLSKTFRSFMTMTVSETKAHLFFLKDKFYYISGDIYTPHTLEMDFICSLLHRRIAVNFSVFFSVYSGLHCDAVWSRSRGCLHNGLQLSHVCPAGVCYCSVQLWQQASLWVAVSLCQTQPRKNPARLLYKLNHWVKGCGELQGSRVPLSKSSFEGMNAYRVCVFVWMCVSKVCVCVSEVSAFFFKKKGITVGGKHKDFTIQEGGDYRKMVHSFKPTVKNLLVTFFT